MAQSTIQTRLCPHCANSIALDTLTCPYCKASLKAAPAPPPQWPSQEDEPTDADTATPKAGLPLGSKIILVVGLLVFALGVFLVGGQSERGHLAPLLEAKDKALHDGAEKITALEAELKQSRDELKTSAAQLGELKAKLSERDQQLATAQGKLKDTSRDLDRLASRPAAPAPLPTVRPRDPLPSSPVPPPAPAASARRAVEPGLYETVRSTSVHEEPLAGSRVVSRIGSGTQITVVRGIGEWLEVRSKIGNPPGFVRAEDAMFVARAN